MGSMTSRRRPGGPFVGFRQRSTTGRVGRPATDVKMAKGVAPSSWRPVPRIGPIFSPPPSRPGPVSSGTPRQQRSPLQASRDTQRRPTRSQATAVVNPTRNGSITIRPGPASRDSQKPVSASVRCQEWNGLSSFGVSVESANPSTHLGSPKAKRVSRWQVECSWQGDVAARRGVQHYQLPDLL